jgi:hypothetical protein
MTRRGLTVILSVIAICSLGGAMATAVALDRMRGDGLKEEELYLPSGRVLKKLSLGYSGLLADIYWTRAVQYFGELHHEKAMRFRLLYPLLEITTELDPHLMVAYEFGSIFLSQSPPEGAGEPERAIALVQRGIRENPGDWHLYAAMGYIEAIELRDYKAASRSFLEGSKLPGSRPWMKVMAAAMAEHGGEAETARFLWTKLLESSDDKMIRENAVRHLRALQVDEDVQRLEDLVAEYQRRTGNRPESFAPFIAMRWLPGQPIDPLGHPYRVVPDGHVYVQNPADLPFITRGIPPGAKTAIVPKTF